MTTRKQQCEAIDELMATKKNGTCGVCNKETYPNRLTTMWGSSQYDSYNTGMMCNSCSDKITQMEFDLDI